MQRSGQIKVTTAGTAVRGTDMVGHFWAIGGAPGNTKEIYVGNDGEGDVSSTTGFGLKAGEFIYLKANNLNELWFDAAESGESACWLRLD